MTDMSPLHRLVDLAERSSTVYRAPDFRHVSEAIRARMRRRALVTSFGIGFGAAIMLAVVVIQVLIAVYQP